MSFLKLVALNGWRSRVRLKSSLSLPTKSSSICRLPTDSYFSIKLECFDDSAIKIEEDELNGSQMVNTLTPLPNVSNIEAELPEQRFQTACSACQLVKPIYCKEMCRACYKKQLRHAHKNDTSKYRECKECGEFRAHYAYGICGTCYRRENYKKLRCEKCSQMSLRNGRKVKERCWHQKPTKAKRSGTNKNTKCKDCKKLKMIDKRRRCNECISKLRECQGCGQLNMIWAREMCRSCYRSTFERPKLLDKSNQRKCGKCRKVTLLRGQQMCGTCNQQIFRTPKILAKRKRIRERHSSLEVTQNDVQNTRQKVRIEKTGLSTT